MKCGYSKLFSSFLSSVWLSACLSESNRCLKHTLPPPPQTQTFGIKFIIMKLQKDFRINSANQTIKESGKRSKDWLTDRQTRFCYECTLPPFRLQMWGKLILVLESITVVQVGLDNLPLWFVWSFQMTFLSFETDWI